LFIGHRIPLARHVRAFSFQEPKLSRDGNGNYTRVPGSGYPNGTTADGPEVDAEMNDIATALTQSLSKDGQTVPTANLPMGGYRHTNVDDAAARNEYARADQVQDGAFSTLSSVSGADTITATAPLSMTAYAAGQKFGFVAAGANTGAVTLNINGIGAKAVTKRGSTALVADDIASGAVVVVQYDGTRFQVISQFGDEVFRHQSGTWTPVVTFATPGDVSVAYTVQLGTYTKIGKTVHLTFDIFTSSFTHTTASGNITITGVPYAAISTANYTSRGALFWGGITKANYTNLVCTIVTGGSTLLISASGSGQTPTQVTASDMPTGGAVTLRGELTYQTP